MIVGSMCDHFLCRASLCTYTRHEEEVVRTEASELLKFVCLCRTNHEHHVVRCRDLHHLLHHCLIKRLSVLHSRLELI